MNTGSAQVVVRSKGGHAARERDGQRMLETAARRAGVRAALDEALARLPGARAFLARLAFYLTPDLPHPAGVPLLDLCLRTALAYYGDSRGRGERALPALFLELVAGAFTPLPALVEVAVRSGGVRWEPLEGEPLALWQRAHPDLQCVPGAVQPELVRTPPRGIRAALAYRLLEPQDIARLPPGGLDRITLYRVH